MTWLDNKAQFAFDQVKDMPQDDAIARLYQIVFDRDVGQDGIEHYTRRLKEGKNKDILSVAKELYASPEFRDRYVNTGGFEQDIKDLYAERNYGKVAPPEVIAKYTKEFKTDNQWLEGFTHEAMVKDMNKAQETQNAKTGKPFWVTYLDTVPSIEDPDDADSQWIYDIEKEYTFSRERWGLDAEQARDIETSFIDSVWGTDGAGVSSYDPEDDLRAWEPDASGKVRSGFDATWGTDLVRIYDKDLKPGTPEMTDYLTKSGPIDWAHYWTDESYVQAFEDLGVGQHDTLSEVEMATKIREARGQIESGGSSDDDGGLKEPTKWEGMYDKNKIRLDEDGNLFIKGKRQKGYLETMEANRYDPVSDEEWQADREQEADYTKRDFKDLGTKEYRKTLNLPSRSKFGLSIKEGGGVKPKRPANLPPSWGKI